MFVGLRGMPHATPAPLPCCRVPVAIQPVCVQEPGTRPPYLPSVHLARGRDAAWLRRKLLELSKPWDTRICEAADGRLSIPLRDERSGGGNDAA